MILNIISGMSDLNKRYQCATNVAKHFKCSHLLILIKDPEIDMLLPAPGFPQTLSCDDQWNSFLDNVKASSFYKGILNFRGKFKPMKATGILSPDGSVAILFGGDPAKDEIKLFTEMLPVLTALFLQEQKTQIAQTKASFAEDIAMRAERLTTTVDGMRLLLKNALVKQEQDKLAIEALLRKKDEFLNIASHELKTPLTSLKAYMQLLQKQGGGVKLPQDIATRSLKQMQRMEKLIADLLDVSKISNGKLDYNMATLNFADLLNETVESIQIISPSHQIIIKNNPDAVLMGDRSRLDQVLINYLTNAIKYSPDDDKVIISSEKQGSDLVVSIQDFGIGIEQEHINKLYDRFYRADSTIANYAGMGLGLFVTSEILIRHGGSFWLESTPAKGSTFFFKLPLQSE